MTYLEIVRQPSFICFLLQLDLSILATTKDAGCCFCGSPLHRSDWKRAGFGVPKGCPDEVLLRHSFVCSKCKCRNTPNSLRWMYYRRYLSGVGLLVSALSGSASQVDVDELCREYAISPQLLRNWRRWWQGTFAKSAFWMIHVVGFGFISLKKFAGDLLAQFEAEWRSLKQKDTLLMAVEFLSRYRSDRRWSIDREACHRWWTELRYQPCFF